MPVKIQLELSDEQKKLFTACAGAKEENYENTAQAEQNRHAWAAQFGEMLVKTLPIGGTVRNIFEVKDATGKAEMKFLVEPNDVTAWVAPSTGTFARNYIQGDVLYVPWTQYASSVYYSLDFARDADFDVAAIALQKLNDSLLRLEEEQGWNLIRVAVNNAASAQRVQVSDNTTGAGFFSKQLFNLMTLYFEKLGKTVDAIYVPPTAQSDIRLWTQTQIDPVTQRQIFENAGMSSIWRIPFITVPLIRFYATIDDKKTKTYKVLDRLFNPSDKLEDGSDVWNGTAKTRYANGQLEVCYAISKPSFGIYAIKEQVRTVYDPSAIKEWEIGIFARFSAGFAIVDSENIVMGIVDRTYTEEA